MSLTLAEEHEFAVLTARAAGAEMTPAELQSALVHTGGRLGYGTAAMQVQHAGRHEGYRRAAIARGLFILLTPEALCGFDVLGLSGD